MEKILGEEGQIMVLGLRLAPMGSGSFVQIIGSPWLLPPCRASHALEHAVACKYHFKINCSD